MYTIIYEGARQVSSRMTIFVTEPQYQRFSCHNIHTHTGTINPPLGWIGLSLQSFTQLTHEFEMNLIVRVFLSMSSKLNSAMVMRWWFIFKVCDLVSKAANFTLKI